MEHVPNPLLSAGLTNIQNDRNAVAHDGGFIAAMFDMDPTTIVVDEQGTDEEIKSVYRAIKTRKPDENIELQAAIGSLVKAVQESQVLNPPSRHGSRIKQNEMRQRLKEILSKT